MRLAREVNWWIPAALQKEIIETSKIDECRDRWVGILIWRLDVYAYIYIVSFVLVSLLFGLFVQVPRS